MTAVLKGYMSPPLGTEKKMAGLQLLHPSVRNGPSRVDELSELSGLIVPEGGEGEEEDEGTRDTDVEYDMVQREEAANMPPHFAHSVGEFRGYGYGAISPAARKRRPRKHHHPRKRFSELVPPRPIHSQFSLSPHALRQDHSQLHSLQERHRRFYSAAALTQSQDYERERLLYHKSDDDDNDDHHSDSSSDEEDPPIIELIYRRTCKDKMKLIVIPLLYFLFFVMAGVFAFYSIEALIESYKHRVRTVSYITVDQYQPAGIALFLQDFATYEGCQFKYGDDLTPHSGNWTPLTPVDIHDNCSTSINVTFNSTLLNTNRTALIFRGPTRVKLKQSLWLNLSVDTTLRRFGAIEFLLLNSWKDLVAMSNDERRAFFSLQEATEPLHTAPAGFRSWVKMYYVIRRDGGSHANLSEFYINTDFSKYNDRRPLENRTSDPIVLLFEWKSPTYEYITDILSTNVWNTLGSLAGVFVTLIKAGEYFYAWIKRLRRERYKKLLKLQEMESENQRLMEEFQRKKEEKKRQRQLSAHSQEMLIN